MKYLLLCYLLPLVFSVASGRSSRPNNVQTVTYREDEAVSLPEDEEWIPPQNEWFRVRGGPERSEHVGNAVMTSMVHDGDQDIVAISGNGRSASNSGIVSAAVDDNRDRVVSSRRGEVDGVVTQREMNDRIQVHVRNRGRVGFQKNNSRNIGRESGEGGMMTRRVTGDDYIDYDYDTNQQQRPETNSRGGSARGGAVTNRNGQRNGGAARPSPRILQRNRNDDASVENRQQKQRVVVDEESDRRVVDYETDDYVGDTTSSRGRSNVKASQVVVPTARARNIVTSRDLEYDDYENYASPPPHEEVAKMARYIVHNSNWTSMATTSTMNSIQGYPFANVFSVSDGTMGDSSGVPYMYLTPLDMSATDLKRDSRASLTMSLAQSDYCRQKKYDPEDPRCAHVILSGRILPVTDKVEKVFARNAVFTRHPDMQGWPKDHGWFFAKMDIEHIVVLDFFGGAKTVTTKDYFDQ